MYIHKRENFRWNTAMQHIDLMDIEGIRIGHAHNLAAATGCTVIISDTGATVGVDVRGGAPGTRETDLLDPVNLVQQAHAILLTGGSAFGLDAAAGVMQYLEEQQIGFDVQVARVPIVCGAALFDLMIGDAHVRPDKQMGYAASLNASRQEHRQGCVGAGAGATAGKILGMPQAMKSGLGYYALQVEDLQVGAIVAANCLGDVYDPQTGEKLAAPLNPEHTELLDTEAIMLGNYTDTRNRFSGNTTIGAIITNATFSKAEATKLASMAQNGYARTIHPAHTMYDGDTIFAMATGQVTADLSTVGFLAAHVMERAVISAITSATGLCGIPSWQDLKNSPVTVRTGTHWTAIKSR
jgi:L-aminopeptidase/D-esterase-like protein